MNEQKEQKILLPGFIRHLHEKKRKVKIYLHSGVCLTGFILDYGDDAIRLGQTLESNGPATMVPIKAFGSIVEA